jgi:hypothetical protein
VALVLMRILAEKLSCRVGSGEHCMTEATRRGVHGMERLNAGVTTDHMVLQWFLEAKSYQEKLGAERGSCWGWGWGWGSGCCGTTLRFMQSTLIFLDTAQTAQTYMHCSSAEADRRDLCEICELCTIPKPTCRHRVDFDSAGLKSDLIVPKTTAICTRGARFSGGIGKSDCRELLGTTSLGEQLQVACSRRLRHLAPAAFGILSPSTSLETVVVVVRTCNLWGELQFVFRRSFLRLFAGFRIDMHPHPRCICRLTLPTNAPDRSRMLRRHAYIAFLAGRGQKARSQKRPFSPTASINRSGRNIQPSRSSSLYNAGCTFAVVLRPFAGSNRLSC